MFALSTGLRDYDLRSAGSADSFSFMHNGCTYWQLVYLNVSQEAVLVCVGVCVVM